MRPSARWLSLPLPAVLSAVLPAILASAAVAQGPGDLMVTPTRITLDDTRRSAEVNLMNNGDKPATYRLSLIRRRMDENGRLIPVNDPLPGEKFAEDLIRFAPRQVTLPPRSGQVVRVQLRLPAQVETGEYRCNLLFRAIPDTSPLPTGEPAPANGLSVRLTPVYGVSIPLIVRHGAVSATVALADLKTETGPEGALLLSGAFLREGNGSVYGDLQVTFTPAGNGKPVPVGLSNGMAVYVPNPVRYFTLPLKPPAGRRPSQGTLTVTYREPATEGGRILAEKTLTVP
ncbi:MAG: hypothetical protein SFU56_02595 [Capsulimonadales bacterium]|nr:hypothetical protein [Capsulimonadales bacterium]